jgi:hypothetical protein
MRSTLFCLSLLLTVVAGAADARMFKCLEGGRTVFQDRPCAGSGTAVTVVPANQSVADPASDANGSSEPATIARLRENVKSLETERRQRDIDHAIRAAEREIDALQSQRDRELAVLQGRKALARNNLAGATWEQSISAEMQAVSDTYRTRIQVVRDRIDDLRKDAAALRGAQKPSQ